MRALAALVCAGAFAGDSAAQATPQPVAVGGVCDEARYKTLVATPFSTMGDEEHKYFLDLDGKCREHKRQLAATVAASAAAYNACAHPPYTALLANTPADMAEREYNYFLVIDRECAAYRAAAGGTPPAEPEAQQGNALPGPERRFVTVVTVLGSIIATLLQAGRD